MAGINRLAELQGPEGEATKLVQGEDTTSPGETTAIDAKNKGPEIGEHMKLYEPIKAGLNLIKANVQKVEKLKAKDRTAASEQQRKEIMESLNQIMGETTKEGTRIKKALDEIKMANAKFEQSHSDSAQTQIRSNLYQTHIRRFHTVMNEYNSASHEFKQNLQNRTRRQLKIVTVDRDISDEEIEKIVESGQANEIIKKAMVSDNLQSLVQDIEERHMDILKLEQQVLEVYELFRDLATLVDIQQESLDVIENRIILAKNYTEQAEVELQHAENYQKKARQRKCCIMIVALVILVVILAPVLATTVGSS
jgi:t-SNARE complex subunit (syntaxin)